AGGPEPGAPPARGRVGGGASSAGRAIGVRGSGPVASVDLFWLPLGAGGWFVRRNGEAYEALAARLARRPALALYHSALEVRVPEGRFVIEMTPIRPGDGPGRGVVAEGPVGSGLAGRLRVFRYEVRR